MPLIIKRPTRIAANQRVTAKKVLQYSPSFLFTQGEQGVWYDPSDMTTLFQDAAGTTPVTGMEQPVGLMLDKSRSVQPAGNNLVSNPGPFTSTTGWSSNGNITTNNNEIVVTSFNPGFHFAETNASLVSGKMYLITIVGRTGIGNIALFTGTELAYAFEGPYLTQSTNQTVTYRIIANSTSTKFRIAINSTAGGQTFFLSSISIQETPGNQAIQTTSAARPVLSARYNLLTYSEQFDNAAWTKVAATVTANATTDPLGGSTADAIIEDTTTAIHYVAQTASYVTGTSYTHSVYAKSSSRVLQIVLSATSSVFGVGAYANFDLTNGVVSASSGVTTSIENAGGGWYKCSVTATAAATVSASFVFALQNSTTALRIATYLGNGTSSIYLWGADLRVANEGSNLPPYQRVGAATNGTSTTAGVADYDAVGFPSYLRFDGTDDFLVTGTINPGAVDKVQVFAGMRNLLVSTTTNYSCVVEYSANFQTNNGVFTLFAPDGLGGIGYDYTWSSKGTSASPARVQTPNYVAPRTTVTSGLGDVSGDSSILRLNGAQVSQSTTDQGTGNYLSYPLYIGRRGGTTLPFNGRLYSLIVRFSSTNLDDVRLLNTEKWVSGKTGIPYTVDIEKSISKFAYDRLGDIIYDRFDSMIERRT